MTERENVDLLLHITELFKGFRPSDTEQDLWFKAFQHKELKDVLEAVNKYKLSNRNKPLIEEIKQCMRSAPAMWQEQGSRKAAMLKIGKVLVWQPPETYKFKQYDLRERCIGLRWHNPVLGDVVRFVWRHWLISEVLGADAHPHQLREAIKIFYKSRETYLKKWGWIQKPNNVFIHDISEQTELYNEVIDEDPLI